MKFYSCSREAEVLTALREQRWPDACEPELRAHVEQCSYCSELVVVSRALQHARRDATRQAPLPSPGILWWRAQVQRRKGAFEKVNKPIVLAEKIAWVGTFAAALALGLWQRHPIAEMLSSLGKLPLPASLSVTTLLANGWTVALLAAGVGTISVLGGVAVYLATKQD